MFKIGNILLAAFLVMSCGSNNDDSTVDDDQDHAMHESHGDKQTEASEKPLSPKETTMVNIGKTHVHIEYSSPGVRGRMIWGGLVTYDKVWSTGAHKATFVDFSTNVNFGGVPVKKGKYGFFTIPGKDKWVVILNSNYDQHLADDYDAALDVARVEIKPEGLFEAVEHLKYTVIDNGNGAGTLSVAWDKIRVSVDIESK
jgi:DUF2911 family protein